MKSEKPERSSNPKNRYLKKRQGRFGTLKRHNFINYFSSLDDRRVKIVLAEARQPLNADDRSFVL